MTDDDGESEMVGPVVTTHGALLAPSMDIYNLDCHSIELLIKFT